jgi:hypothetical protein
LKRACQHPDNILAQATLLAGLVIDDPQQAREWFFSRVLPAAWPTYQPITVGDPAGCGSGVLLLAAASCFPAWAVHLGYVVFQGIDIDPCCVRLAKINCYLYGLNGYALRLAEAAQVAAKAQQRPATAGSMALAKANGATPGQAIRACWPPAPSAPPPDDLTFESLFRAAAAPPAALAMALSAERPDD